jgi:hypothetical protein
VNIGCLVRFSLNVQLLPDRFHARFDDTRAT